MVLYIYRQYCNSRFTHRRARAAAVIFAFCCLLRPPEYLWGTHNNTHVLTAGQVEFECSATTATNSTASTTFITLAGIRGIPWSRVRLLRIHMRSAKNISSRTDSRLWFSASDEGTIHLVRVMYEWGQHAQALNSAPVFSWPTTIADTPHNRTPQCTNQICLMGRWRSLPACLGYQEVSTQAHDRKTSLLLTPDIYTTRDIELQYCVPRHTIE
jgi:hypothetical protein